MANDTILTAIDFSCLSEQYGVEHIGNEFILIDNLTADTDYTATETIFVNHPIKISYSVTVYCVAGSINFRINLKEYTVCANDALVMLNGSIIEYVSATPDACIAVLAFIDDYITSSEHLSEMMNLQQLLIDHPLQHLPAKVMNECIKIYKQMKSKLNETDNSFRKLALKGFGQVLCSMALEYVAMYYTAEQPQHRDRAMEVYQQFMTLVQRDYHQHRSISHYANILCITPKYLSSIVKKVSGRFANEWIDDYVMLEAKMLLKSRCHTIQQISDLLCFPSQSFFAKYFKNHLGCSPTVYQASEY